MPQINICQTAGAKRADEEGDSLGQAYALRTTADSVMYQSVTETCLAIHPVQFWSVGISFVDDGLLLRILA